jgi:AraC-like DNA-binding protein
MTFHFTRAAGPYLPSSNAYPRVHTLYDGRLSLQAWAMTGSRDGRRPRTLVCSDWAELVVRLPPGSVLLLPSQCGFEIRSGRVRELAAVPPVNTSAPTRPRDRRVEKALRALEADPRRRWTLAELAKVAGASRSSLAKVFAAELGETPGAWLARRRLELARDMLQTSDVKLAEVAERVGYASEFALSRAFKRHFGIAPARFRQSGSATSPIRCAA